MSEPDREPQAPGAPGLGDAARTKPPLRARPRLFRTFVGIGIAVLLIGAAGLELSRLYPFTDPREPARAAELAALRGELQAMNSRLDTIAHAISASNTDTSPGDMATRIQDLDSRYAALENQIARTADRDTVLALQDRLFRLEKETAGAMLHRAATILAAANVARAAQLGADFREQLDALRTIAPEDPAVSQLEPFASGGVPTQAMLTTSFPQAAREALQFAADTAPGPTLVGRFWSSIRRLVSVRRVGDVDGNTNPDRLARAQSALDRGDLSGAVIESEAVDGRAAAIMSAWLKNAHGRLTADRVISDLNKRVVQDLVLQ